MSTPVIQLRQRGRKRKTNQGMYTQEDVNAAVDLVIKEQYSERRAAKLKGIPQKTFCRYMKEVLKGCPKEMLKRKRGARTILPKEMEDLFVDYMNFRAKICLYGLTPLEARKAAYHIAKSNGIEVPKTWEASQCAGREWYLQFRLRHPDISLRKPEPSKPRKQKKVDDSRKRKCVAMSIPEKLEIKRRKEERLTKTKPAVPRKRDCKPKPKPVPAIKESSSDMELLESIPSSDSDMETFSDLKEKDLDL